MIQLAAFDIDNTLIDRKEDYIRPSVLEAFERLRQKNIKIVIATGRPYYVIQDDVFNYLNYDYIICGNGTKIVNHDKEVIYNASMNKDIFKRFYKDLIHYEIQMSLEFKEGLFNINGFEDLLHVSINKDVDTIEEGPTTGMGIFRPGTIDYFIENYPELEFIPAGIDHHYDAVVRGENKRKAISLLCDSLHIRPEEVVAVGDGLNDLSMLQYAGLSIAMGNACDELKRHADYVAPKVTEDGVLKAFEDLKII